MKKILLCCLMVLVMVFSGCGSGGQTPVDIPEPQRVEVISKVVQYSGEGLEVDLKIPVIQGMEDTALQQSINNDFEQKAMDFKKAIEDALAEAQKEPIGGDYPAPTYYAGVNYNVPYNNYGLLSINVQYDSYTGGAHGMYHWETLNFDVNTGRFLQLKDLFIPGEDYQSLVLSEIHRQIELEPEIYFPDAVENLNYLPEDQPFYMTDGYVVVYFGLYEIAPYAAGIREFKVTNTATP